MKIRKFLKQLRNYHLLRTTLFHRVNYLLAKKCSVVAGGSTGSPAPCRLSLTCYSVFATILYI